MKIKLKDPVCLILVLSVSFTNSQVCSPIGQLCTATTDCCRGCCEQHTCVERPYACSPDLVPVNGFSSCLNHHCPKDQFCYLREVCPSPCPRMPFCRPNAINATSYYIHRNRNGAQRTEKLAFGTTILLFISVILTFL